MLSKPDFIEKQIVVIHSYELHDCLFSNENLTIKRDGQIMSQVSLHKVFCIFLIWEGTITTKLISKLQEFGIILVLMRQNLTPIDVIGGGMNGNTILRQQQYIQFAKDSRISWVFANKIVWNKLYNQEMLLKKIRKQDDLLQDTAKRIHAYAGDTVGNFDPESLLGIEGNAARYFFKEFFREMDWMGRFPRTKRDINNTLLDMGYTFLFHFIEWLLLLYGFDLYEGFYHRRFYERKSLVCDIVEPFRCIIDLSLRKAYNLGQVDRKDFFESNGGYSIKPEHIKKYSYIFSRAILDNREEMYLFIRGFYRHILAPTDHPFPKFLLYKIYAPHHLWYIGW